MAFFAKIGQRIIECAYAEVTTPWRVAQGRFLVLGSLIVGLVAAGMCGYLQFFVDPAWTVTSWIRLTSVVALLAVPVLLWISRSVALAGWSVIFAMWIGTFSAATVLLDCSGNIRNSVSNVNRVHRDSGRSEKKATFLNFPPVCIIDGRRHGKARW